ncbi:PTS glucose transporter subunit IIB [Malacoplasma penetrans]|nr:PTS glucose transporter subunit IIB [Malacoplasma penetrans]
MNYSMSGNLQTSLKTYFSKLKFNSLFKKQGAGKEKKGNTKEFIAKLSKGLMLPIAMLPIAGIFLGVGSAIVTNAGGNEGLRVFGNFLQVPGNAVFGALPLLFAIAIAIAFTGDAGPAALACFIGYLVFGSLQDALSQSVTDTTGAVIGYNLLFYQGNIFGLSAGNAALPSSLYGAVIGINQLQSSVFGGFVVGFLVAFLYNKFKNIKLHPIIGFFNGVRFVPIVTFLALFPVTILFLMIWPLVGIALTFLGQALGQAVGINSFIFGFIERALVPFGLHHAFYSPLWYTQAGGSIDLTQNAIIYQDGKAYAVLATSTATSLTSWRELINSLNPNSQITVNSAAGDQTMWAFINANLLGKSVWLKELSSGWTYSAINGTYDNASIASSSNGAIQSVLTWSNLTSGQQALGTIGANGFKGVNVGQYLQGKYVFMILGLPAAAAAMVMAAPKENRKLAMSICMSAGFTSLLTGITEPIEYTFLFLAPWLFWGVHASLCALAFGLMNWIGLIVSATGHPELAPHIGMSFSGGMIDWIIYGAIQIQYGSNAWWSFIFGLAYAPIYFFLFYFLIKKFNIQTPGRGENTRLFTKEDYKNKQNKVQINGSSESLNNDQVLALNVVSAYGGFDNIKNVDACITKLRIQIKDQSVVDTAKLMQLGARGTIKPSPQSVYAVFGAEADIIKGNIKTLMENISSSPNLKSEYEKIMNNSSDTSSASEVKPEKEVVKTDSELSKEKVVVNSPFTGEIVSLAKVPDETFSKNMMGVGIAVKPTTGKIYSPIDGKLSLVFDTGHAYSFETEKGTQILIHVGIDSINLKDKSGKELKPFAPNVKTGDTVKVGQEIGTVKLADLKHAKSTITPIIVLNESLEGREIKFLKKSGEIKKGMPLFEVLPKKN